MPEEKKPSKRGDATKPRRSSSVIRFKEPCISAKFFYRLHPFAVERVVISESRPSRNPCGKARPSSAVPGLAKLAEAMESCLKGKIKRMPLAGLDLSRLTPFERRILMALRKTGRGQTISYGELAKIAGHPGAASAVGAVLAKNPFPIFFPCHRVVRADGGIGGFSAGGGVGIKKKLIISERIWHGGKLPEPIAKLRTRKRVPPFLHRFFAKIGVEGHACMPAKRLLQLPRQIKPSRFQNCRRNAPMRPDALSGPGFRNLRARGEPAIRLAILQKVISVQGKGNCPERKFSAL